MNGMPATFWLKLYLLTVPLFFAIDMVWLGVVARSFYRQQLERFLAPQVNWPAAIVFYLLYIGGILYFAVAPALEPGDPTTGVTGSVARAAFRGALFGFFTYATYDLTNLATLERWPLPVVVVDVVWGACLCAAVAAGSLWIGVRVG